MKNFPNINQRVVYLSIFFLIFTFLNLGRSGDQNIREQNFLHLINDINTSLDRTDTKNLRYFLIANFTGFPMVSKVLNYDLKLA
jgi:hypothetical protein